VAIVEEGATEDVEGEEAAVVGLVALVGAQEEDKQVVIVEVHQEAIRTMEKAPPNREAAQASRRDNGIIRLPWRKPACRVCLLCPVHPT
jgi:hypothetical protein